MQPLGSLVCPVLVGRDDLLRLAARRRTEAARARGGLLFLAGEAGIGKTRLLGAIERAAAADGFTVVRGVAFPRDIEVAGGVFLDLARSLGRTPGLRDAGAALGTRLDQPAARAADEGPAGDRHHRRRVLVLDIVDLLAALPASGPVLVTLEDLHWADDLTLEVLAGLARRVADLPLWVVATYRSDELYPRVPMREWRTRLLAGRLAEEARVGRLDREGTAQMATLILGTGLPAPSDLVGSIHARSDGVPLHVEELLAAIRAGHGDPDRSVGGDVPETLDEAILRRAERLSRRARSAADAAAVVGRSFATGLLGEVMGRPAERLAPALTELEREFLVVQSAEAGWLDFRHALIREALYRHVPTAARRRLHGRVADATAGDARFGPAFRSVHLEEAGRRREAFEAALDGGRRAAAMSAHREALELFERARRNDPGDLEPAVRGRMMAELAAEAAANDANEAADRYYAEAAALLEAGGDPLAAVALAAPHTAVRHLLGDDLAARAERLGTALARLDELPAGQAAGAVRARLLAGLSAANMLDRRLEAAISFGEASRGLAIEAGDEPAELDVAATVGSCFVFAGRMDPGWSLLEDGVRRSRAAGLEAQAARAYRMIGSCASVLVEYDLADRWLREGIDYAERVELWNHRHYMAAHLAHVMWAMGSWDEAERVAAHALSDGRGGITTRITALHVMGYVALGRGDLARAEAVLDEARGLGERMAELQRLSPALWGLSEAARLRGDPAAAIAWCERGEAASTAVADAAYLFPFLVTGTRAHLALGDPGAAGAWVERVSAALAQRDIPGTRPAIDHARGLLELARGQTRRARDSLAAAHAGWTARGRAWEGTWAALDLADAHARSKRPHEARRLADEAARRAADLGSRPLAEAAESLARKVRGRASVDAPWAPLSSREVEVARLIADGLTNPVIAARLGIAPKTVTAHVEHILDKLGATRRAEVAAWVAGAAARGVTSPRAG